MNKDSDAFSPEVVLTIDHRKQHHLIIGHEELIDSSVCYVTPCGYKLIEAPTADFTEGFPEEVITEVDDFCRNCLAYSSGESKIFEVFKRSFDD